MSNSENNSNYLGIDRLSKDTLEKIISDPQMRTSVSRNSHLWFFAIYFRDYLKYEMAPFQREVFDLTQNPKNKFVVITSFRASGKTTILAQSFPIWAVVGVLQKKYVVLISKTMEQAHLNLKNIKDELENNAILKQDLGPFEEESDEWKSRSLVIPKYGVEGTPFVRHILHGLIDIAGYIKQAAS